MPDLETLPVTELAKEFHLCPRTISRLSERGKFPRPIRFGRALRWRRADVERWLAEGQSRGR